MPTYEVKFYPGYGGESTGSAYFLSGVKGISMTVDAASRVDAYVKTRQFLKEQGFEAVAQSYSEDEDLVDSSKHPPLNFSEEEIQEIKNRGVPFHVRWTIGAGAKISKIEEVN
jgi:hypothetical protein